MANNLAQFLHVKFHTKNALIRAFKKLRKEGYRCICDATPYTNPSFSPKYVYFKSLKKRRYITPITFYYKGDLEVISGFLESEGISIGLCSFKEPIGSKWFNITYANGGS